MAMPSNSPPEEITIRKSVLLTLVIFTVAVVATSMVLSTISWKRLVSPGVTNVTQNEYKNLSQWQANVIFPNGAMPVDIEHFVYQIPQSPDQSEKILADLSGRCLWWIPTPVNYRSTSMIISCFKEKVKKP